MPDLFTVADLTALTKTAGTSMAKLFPAIVTMANQRVAALPPPSPSVDASLIAEAIKGLGSVQGGISSPPTASPVQLPVFTAMADLVRVNVHLNYNDNDTYSSGPKIMTALDYLGVKHIRTAAPNPTDQAQDKFATFAAKGYKLCLIAGGRSVPDTIASIAAIETVYPGSVAVIEGPNEVNNGGGFGFGQGDTAGALAYQNALYDAVKASPTLAHVEVWAFTDTRIPACKCDRSNFHFYPQGGAAPDADFNGGLMSSLGVNPGKPVGVTEFGYDTAAGGVSQAVTEQQQADLTVAGLKLAASHNVPVYVYELFDTTNYKSSGGLFHDDGTPKLAATAIKSLIGSS